VAEHGHGQRRITADAALRLSLETEKDRLGAELDGIRPLSAAS
jgi:hypothetical protein